MKLTFNFPSPLTNNNISLRNLLLIIHIAFISIELSPFPALLFIISFGSLPPTLSTILVQATL